MTTFETGRKAELAAAFYLQEEEYKILIHNWRTRYCEIDLVALKDSTLYFVEVKYRATNRQGVGLDYITHKKLQQMRFAADMWIANHGWRGGYELSAVEVSGPDFMVTDFVTELEL